MLEISIFIFSGFFIGTLAGLFGIGGGLIIVPIVTYSLMHFHGYAFESALLSGIATSLASIIFSGITATLTHIKNNNVDGELFKKYVVGVILGSILIGIYLTKLRVDFIKYFFILYTFFAAFQIMAKKKEYTAQTKLATPLSQSIGFLFAIISGLVGIGGGTLFVPHLMKSNVPAKRAVGIAATFGLIIGITTTIVIYLNNPESANHQLGLIYLPAILFLTLPSLFFVKLSATWLLQLPDATIKKWFAILLISIGIFMALTS
jgi:uncharacterized membrane protein YfcA